MLLDGKNAVIYGAGGLGAGVARTFAAEDARVFVAGRTQASLEAVVADLAPTSQFTTVRAAPATSSR